jgi:prevent-host-death family protein
MSDLKQEPQETEESIVAGRAEFGSIIGRARYLGGVTVLTSHRKPVVAIVPIDFYRRAQALLRPEC